MADSKKNHAEDTEDVIITSVTWQILIRSSLFLPSGLLYLNVWWVTVVGDTLGMPPEVKE